MEINKLSADQLEEQIELFKDRIETISDYILETEDNSIGNVLLNQKEGYKRTLNFLYEEQRNRKIEKAMNFDSNININILGTKWLGKFSPNSKEDSILVFYPNGVLRYNDIKSSWEINEGKIIISINNSFATMYGRIENNKLIGNAINIQNQEWPFEYKNINTKEAINSFLIEDKDKEIQTNKILENKILSLGKKWNIVNFLFFESESYNIEISQNGILKVNENILGNWFLKNGRLILKLDNIKAELNCEIIQNRIYGLAVNNEGKEWIISGELVPEILKPENCRTLKIKTENRGFGLMASNDETWNNFKLLDNGFYSENMEIITLTSINGQIYEAKKGELPWEATMYNRSIDEDKKHYDIFYGRNPNGGQFLIYRLKSNSLKNEITIGVLNVKSDGITFEIL